MLWFTCYGCGTAIFVPETAVHENVVCENCNMRQRVPASPAEQLPRLSPPTPKEEPPQYVISFLTAITLIVISVALGWIGLSHVFKHNHDDQNFGFAMVFYALLLMAAGQMLMLVRQTARNTWRADRDI